MVDNEYLRMIIEYLNDEFYYSPMDNVMLTITSDNKVGHQEITDIIEKMFVISEDISHAIVFNWLLANGVKTIVKNWGNTYIKLNDIEFNNLVITLKDD